MLAYFLRRSENSLYYLPNDTRIISQKTTFMSPYHYIFLHVSLVLSTYNKPKYFLGLFVSRLYFFVAIQRRWSNKLSLVVFNNDVAKMHLRKQRGDFAKFFLSSMYVATSCVQRNWKHARKKKRMVTFPHFVY